jgi:hypothetical protein
MEPFSLVALSSSIFSSHVQSSLLRFNLLPLPLPLLIPDPLKLHLILIWCFDKINLSLFFVVVQVKVRSGCPPPFKVDVASLHWSNRGKFNCLTRLVVFSG